MLRRWIHLAHSPGPHVSRGEQVSHRTNFSLAMAEGEDAQEYDGGSPAAGEIAALWSAIDQSVQSIVSMTEVAALKQPTAA
jgi:hypothetical protein